MPFVTDAWPLPDSGKSFFDENELLWTDLNMRNPPTISSYGEGFNGRFSITNVSNEIEFFPPELVTKKEGSPNIYFIPPGHRAWFQMQPLGEIKKRILVIIEGS